MDADGFEEFFSSKGRVRILRQLLSRGEMNLTQIIKETGLNYVTVTKHLNYLVKAGIIEEMRIGRIRIYRPNWMNPKVHLLVEVMEGFSR